MARRKKRSSRRLHGLGSAPDAHSEAMHTNTVDAKQSFTKAIVTAKAGRCKTALQHLLDGRDSYGMASAHEGSGGRRPSGSGKLIYELMDERASEAVHLFKANCLDRSKLGGLGRMRRRSRR